MPQETSLQRKEEKLRKMGLVLVEVVRATNEGTSPTSQQEISKALRTRWRVKIASSTLSIYVKELEEGTNPWLRTDGHKVSLISEDRTLMDSKAIEALLLARRIMNGNDRFSVRAWVQKCDQEVQLSEESCTSFLEEYDRCGYVSSEGGAGMRKLNLRAINEDMFYLRRAKGAGLKKRPPRITLAR
jgi:hypothetical protein